MPKNVHMLQCGLSKQRHFTLHILLLSNVFVESHTELLLTCWDAEVGAVQVFVDAMAGIRRMEKNSAEFTHPLTITAAGRRSRVEQITNYRA